MPGMGNRLRAGGGWQQDQILDKVFYKGFSSPLAAYQGLVLQTM